MDADALTLTPEFKYGVLLVLCAAVLGWFLVLWVRYVSLTLDPSQPDEEEERLTRRSMHQAGGASVEQEIENEMEPML